MATILLTSQTIAENIQGPVRVGALSIQDSPGQTFTFTLEDDSFFEVVETVVDGIATYELWVKAGVSFDFESAERHFELMIAVADGDGNPVDADPVVVDVADVNEAPTGLDVIGDPIPDNADLGTVVATLEGVDPDESDELTYAFVTDATGATELTHDAFEIVGGEILVKGELNAGAHNLWVKVTDSGNPALSYVKQITLTVVDGNDPPEVLFDPADVAEGAGGGTVVGTLTFSDPDTADVLTYSLVEIGEGGVEQPSSLFMIDANGNVVVREGVKLLSQDGAYPSFTVKVSDGTNTIYETYDVFLGENQEPSVTFAGESGLPKTVAGGTLLGSLMADDPEGDEVTYALVNGSENLIRIDENGNVYVRDNAQLSYDNPAHRSFTVEYFDGVNRYTETFSFYFENDAPTVSVTSEPVMEGNPVNRVVGRLTADDLENDTLTPRLLGDNAALFSLVKTDDGWDIVLRPNVVLDYENAAHRGLTVEVEVSDGSNTVTETLAIDLVDVDEAPTVTFSASRVNEGAKGGAVVGLLNAADPEKQELTYTLSAASEKYFTLTENGNGGYDIAVQDGVTLDYENAAHRSFSVIVSDGENEVSRTYTLNLIDQVDYQTGSSRKDSLKGTSGRDILKGLAGDDRLQGNEGDDRLHGGSGKDVLTGGSGKDVFVFDTKPSKKTNLDIVWDFNVKDDAIWLENKVFTKLGKAGSETSPAQLNKSYFVKGTKAKDKNDYVIYDSKKGTLYYDADGSGSKYKQVEIAMLKKGLALTYKDFFVI
ncbi:Ca2+-binding RTX toxin-like protein [Microvirga flocculans]|uniref:Ca2+-binding RTX toxin-like protein n=1 Tax=Microvirga flocculans TaxID=217168 RepID=A0A7W6IBG3_9HYPH|nr:hypothetical protein [Microvirga flocculans]MBB4038389.1 Ca2+-binding RTX toxin-like protein [Microvirga flocculans]